jgi:hypothetical protein
LIELKEEQHMSWDVYNLSVTSAEAETVSCQLVPDGDRSVGAPCIDIEGITPSLLGRLLFELREPHLEVLRNVVNAQRLIAYAKPPIRK